MNKKLQSNVSILRVGGGIIALFSIVMILLILFAVPVACSFVGSIQIILLALLFLAGTVAFIVGQFLVNRAKNR